jgi:hypothetical protein
MSHGPCGLDSEAFDPASDCCAIAVPDNVSAVAVSAITSIGTKLILVFMLVLVCFAESVAGLKDGLFPPPSGRSNSSKILREYVYHHLADVCSVVSCFSTGIRMQIQPRS